MSDVFRHDTGPSAARVDAVLSYIHLYFLILNAVFVTMLSVLNDITMLHSYLPKLLLTSLFIHTVCSLITKLRVTCAVRREREAYRRRRT